MESYILITVAFAFVVYGFFGRRDVVDSKVGKLGALRIAAGVSMSFIGGAATIAMAGIGYSNGLIGFVDPAAVLVGGILVAVIIAKQSAPKDAQGIANFLAGGSKLRTAIYAACSFFVYALMAAAQVVALVKIFSPHIGADVATVLSVGLFGFISIYIFLGGIVAVTRTDVVQFLVVAFLFFAPAIFGIAHIVSSSSVMTPIEQVNLDLRTILLLSLSLLFVPLSQDVWLRIRRARTPKLARLGVIVGCAIYFLIVGAAVVLGNEAAKFGLFVKDSEEILPFFFTHELGLAGVVTTVVILAAVMSTLDSFTYNLNSTLTDDMVPFLGGNPDSSGIKLTVAFSVFIMVTAIATAASSILGLVLTALMIYVAVIGPGFVLAKWARSEISLWLPALITMVLILVFSMAKIQMPWEPYSFILGHAVLILLVSQGAKLGRGR